MLLGGDVPFERNRKLNEYEKLLGKRKSRSKVGQRNKKTRKRRGRIAKGVLKGAANVVRFIPRPIWDAGATAAGTLFGNPEAGYLAGEVIRAGAGRLIDEKEEPIQRAQMDTAIGNLVSRGAKHAMHGRYQDFMRRLRENEGTRPLGTPRYWDNEWTAENPYARTAHAPMDYQRQRRSRIPEFEMESEPSIHWSEPYSRMDYSERSYGSKPMSVRSGSRFSAPMTWRSGTVRSVRGLKRKKNLRKHGGRDAKRRPEVLDALMM